LQDLARGIYPSVLVDGGLAAALRAQATRLPLEVRVELEPGLTARRFEPAVEACLYFVAQEALTNVQKHCAGARVSISLRSGASHSGLELEVHDDGPGFDAAGRSTGSGLQNMRDRLSAMGGTLTIDTRPAAGTWIKASLPLNAMVVALRTVEQSPADR
jgi:signal transduction histidine kinase